MTQGAVAFHQGQGTGPTLPDSVLGHEASPVNRWASRSVCPQTLTRSVFGTPRPFPQPPDTLPRHPPPRRRAPGRAPGFGTFCCILCAPLGPTVRVQQSQLWPLPVQECPPPPTSPGMGLGLDPQAPGGTGPAVRRRPSHAVQAPRARPGARVELSSVALPASAVRAERCWGAVAGVPRQVLLHCPAPGAAGRGGRNTTVALGVRQ